MGTPATFSETFFGPIRFSSRWATCDSYTLYREIEVRVQGNQNWVYVLSGDWARSWYPFEVKQARLLADDLLTAAIVTEERACARPAANAARRLQTVLREFMFGRDLFSSRRVRSICASLWSDVEIRVQAEGRRAHLILCKSGGHVRQTLTSADARRLAHDLCEAASVAEAVYEASTGSSVAGRRATS